MARRPLRRRFDETIRESEPRLRRFGGGNVFGAVNYFASSVAKGLIPVRGLKAGYQIESSSKEESDGVVTHTYEITASNEALARFAASYLSSPTNVDYIADKPKIKSSETLTERTTLSTYEVVVERDVDGLERMERAVNGMGSEESVKKMKENNV